MSIGKTRWQRQLLVPALALGLLSACSDDDSDGNNDETLEDGGKEDAGKADSGTKLDGGKQDGGDVEEDGGDIDSGDVDGGTPDAEVDAALPPVDEKLTITALSAAGADRFYGVTYDNDGKILAVGQSAETSEATADFSIIVARFTAQGVLDTTFGTQGVAKKNVTVGGIVAGENGENARGIVVLPDGKIVVAGQAEHDPSAAGLAARDMDVVLVRFTPNGQVDTTWGTEGVVRHDLNTGIVTTNTMGVESWSAADVVWSLGLSGTKFVVHGNQRATGVKDDGTPRTDSDFALLRLNADGSLDTTFSTDGKVTLDVGLAGNSARSATVFADGSIIGSGYTTTTGLISDPGQSTQQPVLYKVNANGEFDATFATADKTTAPGVFYDLVVPQTLRCEAYGAAVQGDKLVTVGYGPTKSPAPSTGSDIIYARFSKDGAPDEEFGTMGTTYQDPGGYGDNGRALIILPDNRIVGLGGARPAPATPPAAGTNPPVDAFVGVLTENGAPDEAEFGVGSKGFKLYDLGGTNDFFWAGALAGDKRSIAIVGIASANGTASATENDDSALLILPVR